MKSASSHKITITLLLLAAALYPSLARTDAGISARCKAGDGTAIPVPQYVIDRTKGSPDNAIEVTALRCPYDFTVARIADRTYSAQTYREALWSGLKLDDSGDPSQAIKTFSEKLPAEKLKALRDGCKSENGDPHFKGKFGTSPMDFWFCVSKKAAQDSRLGSRPEVVHLYDLTRRAVTYTRYGLASCMKAIGKSGESNAAMDQIAQETGTGNPWTYNSGEGISVIEGMAWAPPEFMAGVTKWADKNCKSETSSCLCSWGMSEKWNVLQKYYSGQSSGPATPAQQAARDTAKALVAYDDAANNHSGATTINSGAFDDIAHPAAAAAIPSGAGSAAAASVAPSSLNTPWAPSQVEACLEKPAAALLARKGITTSGTCATCHDRNQNQSDSFLGQNSALKDVAVAADPNIKVAQGLLAGRIRRSDGSVDGTPRVGPHDPMYNQVLGGYEGQLRLAAIKSLIAAKKMNIDPELTGVSNNLAGFDSNGKVTNSGSPIAQQCAVQFPGADPVSDKQIDVLGEVAKYQAAAKNLPPTYTTPKDLLMAALTSNYMLHKTMESVSKAKSDHGDGTPTYDNELAQCVANQFMRTFQSTPHLIVGANADTFNVDKYGDRDFNFSQNFQGLDIMLKSLPATLPEPPLGFESSDPAEWGKDLHDLKDANGSLSVGTGSCKKNHHNEAKNADSGAESAATSALYLAKLKAYFEPKVNALLAKPEVREKLELQSKLLYRKLGEEIDKQIGDYCTQQSGRSSQDVLMVFAGMPEMARPALGSSEWFGIADQCYRDEVARMRASEASRAKLQTVLGVAMQWATLGLPILRGAGKTAAMGVTIGTGAMVGIAADQQETAALAEYQRQVGSSAAANVAASLTSPESLKDLQGEAFAGASTRNMVIAYGVAGAGLKIVGLGVRAGVKAALPGIATSVATRRWFGMLDSRTAFRVKQLYDMLKKNPDMTAAELDARAGAMQKITDKFGGKYSMDLEVALQDPLNGPLRPFAYTNEAGLGASSISVAKVPGEPGKWQFVNDRGVRFGRAFTREEIAAHSDLNFHLEDPKAPYIAKVIQGGPVEVQIVKGAGAAPKGAVIDAVIEDAPPAASATGPTPNNEKALAAAPRAAWKAPENAPRLPAGKPTVVSATGMTASDASAAEGATPAKTGPAQKIVVAASGAAAVSIPNEAIPKEPGLTFTYKPRSAWAGGSNQALIDNIPSLDKDVKADPMLRTAFAEAEAHEFDPILKAMFGKLKNGDLAVTTAERAYVAPDTLAGQKFVGNVVRIIEEVDGKERPQPIPGQVAQAMSDERKILTGILAAHMTASDGAGHPVNAALNEIYNEVNTDFEGEALEAHAIYKYLVDKLGWELPKVLKFFKDLKVSCPNLPTGYGF